MRTFSLSSVETRGGCFEVRWHIGEGQYKDKYCAICNVTPHGKIAEVTGFMPDHRLSFLQEELQEMYRIGHEWLKEKGFRYLFYEKAKDGKLKGYLVQLDDK